MTSPLDPDAVSRTALLSMLTGAASTLEEAQEQEAHSGCVIVADPHACQGRSGQAALLTALVTAVRAFGNVQVELSAMQDLAILGGVHGGRSLLEVIHSEGASLHPGQHAQTRRARPVILIGGADLPQHLQLHLTVLRATWHGWTASVSPRVDRPALPLDDDCVLAATAAGALVVHEAFGAQGGMPGTDVGFRTVSLDLWSLGSSADPAPKLTFAPSAWWLVGLGHLGQSFAWALSWLAYEQPELVSVVLQDTATTTPSNHSTGVLTPRNSQGQKKTRLVAAGLESAGFDVHLHERLVRADLRLGDDEHYVALLGLDKPQPRQLISKVGWALAIDAGLGRRSDFNSLTLYAFPGARSSDEIQGWKAEPAQAVLPDTPAFKALDDLDSCGAAALAGRAAGASFVGVLAASLALAEACRDLCGGEALDQLTVHLSDEPRAGRLPTRRTTAPTRATLHALPLR